MKTGWGRDEYPRIGILVFILSKAPGDWVLELGGVDGLEDAGEPRPYWVNLQFRCTFPEA
jgi:hypothetical protein